ncbi:MAG: hypothetical protein COS84_11705 [Armatimonadetes bacterium CG07_land_8_20_14_0_80_40_9]|nr:MAG: hypothetical protein COS84_11705 [Armatimonadetes bacterium CG07_land_8_20_14_0_80_40_9]
MEKEFEELLESTLRIKEEGIDNKVMSLSEAIRENIKPGMTLHGGATHLVPYALCYEIIRQFWGKRPEFTFLTLGAINHLMIMIHGSLVKKIIATYYGLIYPTPGPDAVFQKAYSEKKVEFEDWSILTFTQRLMAGALGLEFFPTKSLKGSGMEKENANSFLTISDPFGSGREVGLVKAFKPDISLYHGWAADKEGNTILTPPYSENLWGAYASKGGVIVSVEKIVSTSFIRQHSHLVKIPGSIVKAVVEVPFGAHPGGISNTGLREFEHYAEDYDFLVDFRKQAENEKTFSDWIKEWVLDCPNHKDYTKKLGEKRVLHLKGRAHQDAWRYELNSFELSLKKEYNPLEMMTVVAGRRIREKIKENKYRYLLAGIGNSNLAAWFAYYTLKEEGETVELIAELGFYGYEPRPGDPFIFNFANIPTCKMTTDITNIIGVLVGGQGERCIGSLSAGQVDKYGNFNSTKVGEMLYLVGSGGANDVACCAQEVALVIPQSKMRFLDTLPYVTGIGNNVSILVSHLGVFEKIEGELTLSGYFPSSKFSSPKEIIDNIKSKCSWELKVSKNLEEVPPPTEEELRLLRLFDPRQSFIGKLTPFD